MVSRTKNFRFVKLAAGLLALLTISATSFGADTIASVKSLVMAGTAGATTTYTLTGYVSARNLWSSSVYEIALQDRIDGSDATRGLVVYDNKKTGYGSRTALPPIGAQVTVTGTVTNYGGMTELLPTEVYTDDATTRTIVPRAIKLSEINDNSECVLCKVYGIHMTNDTAKKVYNITTSANVTIAATDIADGDLTTGSMIFLPKYLAYETSSNKLTSIDASTATGSPYFNMVGLAQQYQYNGPATGGTGYEFTPRYMSDVIGTTQMVPVELSAFGTE